MRPTGRKMKSLKKINFTDTSQYIRRHYDLFVRYLSNVISFDGKRVACRGAGVFFCFSLSAELISNLNSKQLQHGNSSAVRNRDTFVK